MKWKSGLSLLKNSAGGFSKHGAMRLGAALAYYSMFSIGPLLLIVMGLAGLVFGRDAVRHEIEQQIQQFVGSKAAHVVESMAASSLRSKGVLATILGIAALLFGATGVFSQLQDALNLIWEVKAKPGLGIWGYLRYRILSFAMILGIGFLLLISMALTTALAALSGWISGLISSPQWLVHALNFLISFGVITLLFAAIFKVLPDVKLRWRDVWIGAIGTAFLFTAGKYVLGLYLGRESTASSYGAAGSVIVILMWVYYGSLILFFGAEFTRAYAKEAGSQMEPSHYAVPLTEKEKTEQGIVSDEKLEAAAARKQNAAKKRSGELQIAPQPAHATSRDNPLPILGMLLAAGIAVGALLETKLFRKRERPAMPAKT
jgi:membrane protein